jgi:hypothetical protein
MCLVVVMEDGFEKRKLEEMEMPPCDPILAKAVDAVLTPGVWLSWD